MKPEQKSLLTLLLLVGGCLEPPTGPQPITNLPRALTASEQQLVQSNNRFAFKLLREISRQQPDGNLFISPLSVEMALAMTYNGAAGETRDSMAQVLELQNLTLQQADESYLHHSRHTAQALPVDCWQMTVLGRTP